MGDEGVDMLGTSWHDSAWIPILNPGNIMDYFARSTFYDRTCNNEMVKMQRQSLDHLVNMTGTEYKLVHVQQPILYIIRKQERQGVDNVIPIAQYYIIAGKIYQAPDMATVVNSRLLNAIFNLNNTLTKTLSCSKYHPSKGYWWDFKDEKTTDESSSSETNKEQASWFQRQRVDLLLGELARQYPMKVIPVQTVNTTETKQELEARSQPKGEKRSQADAELTQPEAKLARVKTEPFP